MPATLDDIQKRYGESVYPIYKDQLHEPFMENTNGNGYQGVIMYNEIEDKIQCVECGKWFGHMSSHFYFFHKTNPTEYKEKYGISSNVPLCSKKYSSDRREVMIDRIKNGYKQPPCQSKKGEIRARPGKISQAKNRIGYKNRYGLCDAQIAARIIVVGDMVHKKIEELTSYDFEKFDKALISAIRRKYGNYQLASKALGLGGNPHHEKYEDSGIIAALRSFVIREKRMPVRKDFNVKSGLTSISVICQYFGSWNRAKTMAGLQQILEDIGPEGEIRGPVIGNGVTT